MYKLDSGFVSIIATILAIMIGIYSAVDKRAKERAAKKGKVYEMDHEGDNEVEQEYVEEKEEVKMFHNPFEEMFGGQRGHAASASEIRKSHRVVEEDDDDLFSFINKGFTEKRMAPGRANVVMEEADEFRYSNGMESVENASVARNTAGSQASNSATAAKSAPLTVFADGGSIGVLEKYTMVDGKGTTQEDGRDMVIEDGAIGDLDESLVKASASRDLKGRLKAHPQDLIFFSEILKPKYQDI